MKARIILTGCLIAGISLVSYAQVEYDDMYFNGKDREKLNAQKEKETDSYALLSGKKSKKTEELYDSSNPTDSYSARNINPEYVSRSNAETAAADEDDYFDANYQYQYNTASQYNNWNNNFNSWYSRPSWYSPSWYGPAYNGWNSPYYSSWNNPWNDPYYYDYYSPYSSPYSYYGGSSWSMSLTWGNPYYYNPYSYGPAWGWGSAYYCRNWYYPRTTVVVVNNNDYTAGRKVTYGRRSSRGGSPATATTVDRGRTRTAESTYYGSHSGSVGGRTSAPTNTVQRSTRQEEYYNRSWRSSSSNTQGATRTPTTTNTRSSAPTQWSGSGNNNRSYTPSNSGYNRSSSSSSSPSYNRGSSGSSPSYTPSRSSGSSSGSGSGGRTRGRD